MMPFCIFFFKFGIKENKNNLKKIKKILSFPFPWNQNRSEKNLTQNLERNQNQNAKIIKIKKLRQTHMNLWWEEKELGQMLANLDERYHAIVAISTNLCKTERATSKTQTIAHHCPPCKRGGWSVQERRAYLCKRALEQDSNE